MIKTMMLVPEVDNAGHPFLPDDWTWLLHEATQRFGGLTLEGQAQGWWLDAGHLYQDATRRYTIALASWRQVPEWLALVEAVRERFRQIAVYGEIAGIPEIFSG